MEGYTYIKSERMGKGIMPEEISVRLAEDKKERLAEDDIQHFCDMIFSKRTISKCIFTIGILLIDINYIHFIFYKHRKNHISKTSGHFISCNRKKITNLKNL
jgi:hypothetical protein